MTLVGYARVSTIDQHPEAQARALAAAGTPAGDDPERTEAARRMLAEGQSVAQIARTLGVHRASLYRSPPIGARGASVQPPAPGRRDVPGGSAT